MMLTVMSLGVTLVKLWVTVWPGAGTPAVQPELGQSNTVPRTEAGLSKINNPAAPNSSFGQSSHCRDAKTGANILTGTI